MTTAPQGSAEASFRRRSQLGLTLLEVLAAFLIFAMVFTVLVGSSQTAVHSQGLASRRLEASLIADEVLSGLESQLQQKLSPIIDDDASQDIFEVSVEESSFAGTSESDPADASPQDPSALAGGIDATALLALELPDVARFLKRYDVEVQWMEAEGPQSIARTTFAFDWQTATIELAELFQATSAGDSDSSDSGDDDEDEDGGEERGGGDRREEDRGSSSSGGSDLEAEKERMRKIIEGMQ